MRQIGKLEREQHASRFAAYLITQEIDAQAEQDGESWVIWVRDENRVEAARDLLKQFQNDPDNSRYRGAEKAAASLHLEKVKKHQDARKNLVEMGGKWGSGKARKAPLVFTLIALSVLATIVTEFGSGQNQMWPRLSFVDPAHTVEKQWSENNLFDTLIDIRRGEVWRLVSPIFVHLTSLHLIFNMYWLYYFGIQIEDRKGAIFLGLFVLTTAALSNIAQAGIELPWFGGMSGVGYAMFGYIWMKTYYDSGSGFQISQSNIFLFLAWFFLCLTGMLGPVANTAHGVGLVAGVLAGYVPTLWKSNPKN